MSTQKFHVTKSGKVEPCLASARSCPLSQFSVETDKNGQIKVTNLPSIGTAEQKESSTTTKVPASMPIPTDADQLRTPPLNYVPDLNESFGFIMTAQYEATDAWRGQNAGKELDRIDLPMFLARLHNSNIKEVPKELIDYAYSQGFGDLSEYEVVKDKDYYGIEDNYYVRPRNSDKMEKFLGELEVRYWAPDNRRDSNGVLAYARSKGLATAGLSPLDALKKQLAEENPGVSNPRVENARYIFNEVVDLEDITIPNMAHYNKVRARQPKTSAPDASEIIGVVYLDRNKDTRILVDGYHRLKHARTKSGKRGGRFLVIH